MTVVSSGPMTNIDLLEAVGEFVFMGGAVGAGNRSAVAKYYILTDRASISQFYRQKARPFCQLTRLTLQ